MADFGEFLKTQAPAAPKRKSFGDFVDSQPSPAQGDFGKFMGEKTQELDKEIIAKAINEPSGRVSLFDAAEMGKDRPRFAAFEVAMSGGLGYGLSPNGRERVGALGKGVVKTASDLMALPAFALAHHIPEEFEEAYFSNPLFQITDRAQEALNTRSKRYGRATLPDLIDAGNYGGAADYVTLSVLENLPHSLAVMALSAAGVPAPAALGTVGSVVGAGRYRELRKRKDIPKQIALSSAGVHGAFEGIGEAYGSFGLFNAAKSLVKTVGLQTTKDVLKTMVKLTMEGSLREGLEEVSTQFAQDLTDNIFKTADTESGVIPTEELWPRAWEAGIIGMVSGTALGGAATVATVPQQRKAQIEAFRKAGLDPANMTVSQREEWIDALLPEDIKKNRKKLRIRAKSIHEGRLSDVKGPLPDDVKIEQDRAGLEPVVDKIAEGKEQVFAEKSSKMDATELQEKNEIIKEKTGFDTRELPPALREQLWDTPIDVLKGADKLGPSGIAGHYQNHIFQLAGDVESGAHKFIAVKNTPDSKGNSRYHFKLYQRKTSKAGAQPIEVSPVEGFVQDRSNEELFEMYKIEASNVEVSDQLTRSIKTALRREIARRRAVRPESLKVPSEKLAEKDGKLQAVTDKIVGKIARKSTPSGVDVEFEGVENPLVTKMRGRQDEILSDLEKGKTPEETVAKSRKEFWETYATLKPILIDLITTYRDKIKVESKSFITVRKGTTGHLEGGTSLKGTPKEIRGTPTKGSVRVAARAVIGPRIVDSRIEIDEVKIKEDYRRLKAGEAVESSSLEQFSPDTFVDFPNQPAAYRQYAIIHEMVHILAGINGDVLDENLVKLLALELGREMALDRGIQTPNLDLEIDRISAVMRGDIPGHKANFPWTINKNKVYSVSYRQLSVDPGKSYQRGIPLEEMLSSLKAEVDDGNVSNARTSGMIVGINKAFEKKGKISVKQYGAIVRTYRNLFGTEKFEPGIVSMSMKGEGILKLRGDTNVEIVEISQPVRQNVDMDAKKINEGTIHIDVKARNDIHQAKVDAEIQEWFDEKQQIDTQPENVGFEPIDVVEEERAQEEMQSAIWAASEEGSKALRSSVSELSNVVEESENQKLYNNLMAFMTLYEQYKEEFNDPSKVFEEHPDLKQLVEWLATKQGLKARELAREGNLDPSTFIARLPDELRKALEAHLDRMRGKDFKERALGYETHRELNAKPAQESNSAPTRTSSRMREAWNAWERMTTDAFGWMFPFNKKSKMVEDIEAAGREDYGKLFTAMLGPGDHTRGQIVSAWNNTLRRKKMDYIGEQDTLKMMAYHISGDVQMQVIYSMYKNEINNPDAIVKTLNGKYEINQEFLERRLELMWKASEEVRSPSVYADNQWHILVPTLTGQGKLPPSEAFLENNKDALKGSRARPPMHYFNQLTAEEKVALAFSKSWETRIRDTMLANGYWKHAAMVRNIQNGYFMARWRRPSEEIIEGGSNSPGLMKDDVMTENMKKSIDADDFQKRAGDEQGMTVLSTLTTALADYIYEHSLALANKRLANDIAKIDNPMRPVGWGAIVWQDGAEKILKDSGWKTRKDSESGKTFWVNPKKVGEDVQFPKAEYEIHDLLGEGGLGYSRYPFWPALKKKKGNQFLDPWMDKRLFKEFDSIFKSEYDQRQRWFHGVTHFNFIAKLAIMYSPMFQLAQVGTSIAISMMNPVESLKLVSRIIANDPMAAMNPFLDVGRERRSPFETTIKQGPYADKWDLIRDANRHNVATANTGNVFNMLFDYQSKMKKDNPDATLYGQALNAMTYSSRFMWETWLGNMQLGLWIKYTDKFKKQGYPEFTAKRLASITTNTIVNMPGRHLYGKEKAIIDVFLFARDFAVTISRLLTGALGIRGETLAQLPGGRYTKSLAWGDATPQEMRNIQPHIASQLVKGLGIGLLSVNLLNLITTALFSKDKEPKWAWQNEDNKKLSIFLYYEEETKRNVYVNTPLFQEFFTLLQAMPDRGRFRGLGKGPLEWLTSRISASMRLLTTVFSNVDYANNQVIIDSPDADLNDWFMSVWNLSSTVLPDFARSSREENKPFWEYILTYFGGSPTTRGLAGYETVKYFFDPYEWYRYTRYYLPKLKEAQKKVVKATNLDREIEIYMTKHPLSAPSIPRLLAKREDPGIMLAKNIKATLKRMPESYKEKVIVGYSDGKRDIIDIAAGEMLKLEEKMKEVNKEEAKR